MTLLSAKVSPKTIRTSIMAGKLSGILMAADREIRLAENFRENADWTEMLRIMEGTLDQEVDHEMTNAERSRIKRSKFE